MTIMTIPLITANNNNNNNYSGKSKEYRHVKYHIFLVTNLINFERKERRYYYYY